MPVLSRNTHDAVTTGDDIEIRVLSISGDTVKLGVQAPADVTAHRSEVYVKIEREKYAVESTDLHGATQKLNI